MRRQAMAALAAVMCVAMLGVVAACGAQRNGAGAPGGSTPTSSASQTGHPNFPACRAASDSRIGILNAVVSSDIVLKDPASSKQEIATAGIDLATAFSDASVKMSDAAGETDDAGLKAAIVEMSDAAKDLAAAATAAGSDRDKLMAATRSDAFDAAERKMLAMCRDALI